MSRLVARVVEAARDRHTSFDARRQPPGPVYRFLADYVSELQNKILKFLPEYSQLEVTTSFPLPLASFDDGMALDPCRLVTEVVAVGPVGTPDQTSYNVAIVSEDTRFALNSPTRSCWQDGDVIFLRGPASNWVGLGSIEVTSVPVFGDVSADLLQWPTAVLPLPDAAGGACSAKLAAFMAERSEGLDAVTAKRIIDRGEAAEQAFLQHVIDRFAGTRFTTVDVRG